MRKLIFLLLVIQCAICLQVFSQGGGGVRNGRVAPEFTALDQDGNIVSLIQFKGKKFVVYFNPKYDMSELTAETRNLRDNFNSLTEAGYTVICVRTNDQNSNKDFKTTNNIPFAVISDGDKKITEAYAGTRYNGEEGKTYVIGENGKVIKRIKNIDPPNHAQQVLSSKARK